jgi:UDP-N-acetylmuramoyl-L-alanyl-D-glutamate--2,6-diaminopimelate ligase
MTIDLGGIDSEHAGRVLETGRLTHDSRLIEPGDVFAVLRGHDPAVRSHIQVALDRGAQAVLAPVELEGAVALDDRVIGLADFTTAIGTIASRWYGDPSASLFIVGVTGTNGKTSTVQLLAQAWHALGARAATIGTLGAAVHGDELTLNGFTTPPVTRVHELLAMFRDRGVTHVGMEVSSHALEEHRVAGVEFDVVGFTNLTRDHLDYHGTMEHYAAQKAKIFDLRGASGPTPGWPLAVGNLDDPFVAERLAAIDPARSRVGVSSRGAVGAQISAEALRFEPAATGFDLVADGERIPTETPLIGQFNVDNLLIAIAALRHQGVPLAEIAALAPHLVPVHGRMTRIRLDDALPTVVVDAGHTPDALRQALTAINEYSFDRVITVFGCTGDRDPGKRPQMAKIAEDASDVVIVTDDDVHFEDGDAIVADILGGMAAPEAATVIRDRTSAIEAALRRATPADVVLLAGKGHEPFQIIGHDEVPFSDIETAKRLLAGLLIERTSV